jgi:CRP-like cAMP-binding protein
MLTLPVSRTYTFESLPDDVMAVCRSASTTVRVARGHTLIRRGDPAQTLFVVLSGYARVSSVSLNGHEVVAAFVGPRDVIGHRAAMTPAGSYLVTAVAVGPMELASWSRPEVLQLRTRFPAVHASLDARVVRNTDTVLNRLHTLSEGKVLQRLAKVLIELAERHGTRQGDAVSLPVPLTRQDLAALTGTTIYSASRIVADWVDAGILESHRARINVKSLERLIELADT